MWHFFFFILFGLFFFSVVLDQCDAMCCIQTMQLYRRCDAAVIDDNAQSANRRVLDTAAVANAPAKEHDRRLKKNAEKCRTKTGMYNILVFLCCSCMCTYSIYCVPEKKTTSFKNSMGFNVCLTVEILHSPNVDDMINVLCV